MRSRLFIASDHGGLELKESLKGMLAPLDTEIIDLGVNDETSVDYPDYAHKLCDKVLGDHDSFGILICGTGLGMSMAANRHKGIRAALCTDPYCSRMAREHNDANILCLGGRVLGPNLAFEVTRVFLETEFGGDRHQRRIDKLDPGHK